MNYNRRATRPDGLYYRDARKVRPGRRRAGMRVGGVIAALALAAVAIYWMMH